MPDYIHAYVVLFALLIVFVVLIFLFRRMGFSGSSFLEKKNLVVMESGFLSRSSRYYIVKLGCSSLLIVEGGGGVFVKDVDLRDS